MAAPVLIALGLCGAYLVFFAAAGRYTVARNWFPGTGVPKPPAPKGGGRG